jgi:hypothetical protein
MRTRFREPTLAAVGRTTITRLQIGAVNYDVCVEELDGEIRYAAPNLFPYSDFGSLEEIKVRLTRWRHS